MRRFGTLLAVGGATLLLLAGPGWAWQLDNLGRAGGWDDINKNTTVTAVIDTSDFTPDMPAVNTNAALLNAFGTWDGVARATNLNFSFKPDLGGNYDAFDGPADSNGPPWFNGYSNTLDLSAHWRYANIVVGGFLPQSYFGDPGIIAVTWTGKISGDGSRKASWHTEVYFNDAWNWTDDANAANADFANDLANGIIDLETVALHELGHAIGLDHEDAVPSVMATYYDGVQRTLFADDIAGITSLYSNRLRGGGNGKNNFVAPSSFDDETDVFLVGVTYASDGFGLTPMPEPATCALLVLGAVALMRRKGA